MISILKTIKFTSPHLFSIMIIHLPSELYSICFYSSCCSPYALLIAFTLSTPCHTHPVHSSSCQSCIVLIIPLHVHIMNVIIHILLLIIVTPFSLHLNYNYVILSHSCFFVVHFLITCSNLNF